MFFAILHTSLPW